jgi:hypothetical protein
MEHYMPELISDAEAKGLVDILKNDLDELEKELQRTISNHYSADPAFKANESKFFETLIKEEPEKQKKQLPKEIYSAVRSYDAVKDLQKAVSPSEKPIKTLKNLGEVYNSAKVKEAFNTDSKFKRVFTKIGHKLGIIKPASSAQAYSPLLFATQLNRDLHLAAEKQATKNNRNMKR